MTPVLWLLVLRPVRSAAGVVAMVARWLVVMGPPPLPTAGVELITLMIVQAAVVLLAVRGVVRPPRAA